MVIFCKPCLQSLYLLFKPQHSKAGRRMAAKLPLSAGLLESVRAAAGCPPLAGTRMLLRSKQHQGSLPEAPGRAR
jgi:hypothetical protein